jgi:hypothetical protein
MPRAAISKWESQLAGREEKFMRRRWQLAIGNGFEFMICHLTAVTFSPLIESAPIGNRT